MLLNAEATKGTSKREERTKEGGKERRRERACLRKARRSAPSECLATLWYEDKEQNSPRQTPSGAGGKRATVTAARKEVARSDAAHRPTARAKRVLSENEKGGERS